MKTKVKTIGIAASCVMIAAFSAGAISTTFAVGETGMSEKDYTQAPYYYALEEWFDYFDYSEEQRAQFLADTEVLDNILYDDDYWNNGNYEFCDETYGEENAGIEAYSVTYPVVGFESGTYFSNPIRGVGCPPCTHHLSGCNTDGSCGCRSVQGGIQCYGFANMLHWIYNGTYFNINQQVQGLDKPSWNVNSIKTFFTNKVPIGTHVRLHCKNKNYFHSYTVLQKSSTGIKVYDANWDGQCGIRITDVTWSQIYSYFDYILYIMY